MSEKKEIEQKIAEFRQLEIFQGNMIHGVTGFIDDAWVIGAVTDFLRTALTDIRTETANETLELFKILKREAEIAKEPVFLHEMENQISHLSKNQ